MRKTSQDGGDFSATSGVENEIKKPKACLLEFKSKKIGKRTAPNLSEESDDAVVEPLLQKTTDKTIQSAKYFAKAKADTVKEISKLFNDKKSQYASTSGFGTTETLLSEKEQVTPKPNPSSNAPIHNYMNTNIFHSHDNSIANGTTKSQLLVEIDGSKQSGYNPSPLIFTTAKIHTDGKSKHMEPVQMTPGPISSTVEVSVSKGGSITTNEKKVSNGTSVMNTIYSQPHANEKTKENNVNVSNSNKTSVTLSIDSIMTDKNSNPTKPFTTKVNSPTDIHSQINEKIKDISTNISNSNIASVTQSQDVAGKATNPIKSFTTFANNPLEIRSPSETTKSNLVDDVKNKPDTKKLVDEPRILMCESKLKSTISDNTKTSVSLTKSPLEPTKTLESSTKEPQTSPSNKNDKFKSENIWNTDQDKKVKNMDTQPFQSNNIKTPIVTKEVTSKSNTNSTTLQQQKNTPTEVCAPALKTESLSSKRSESANDPSAKTLSLSKTPTQPKLIDSKLSKEIDKSPKPSANEKTKSNSKISLNSTAMLSTTKIPTSASMVKPASNATLPKVVSSSITNTSNKASNSKEITAMVATCTTSVSPSTTKTQSSSTKTATSTANTKPTSVTSTKSSTKPSASIKSPQIVSTSKSATKQPNTTTAKNMSGKPPPLAFTKTPPVNTSSPSTTVPTAKSTLSKAQVSTSNTTGHTSSSISSSETSVDTSIKTKGSNLNKKGASKPGDPTKDTKVSKA